MVRFVMLSVAALALFLSVGLAVSAQDGGTPQPVGTPGELECPTPLAEAQGATPVMTVIAPTTAADEGGAAPGTPIGLFPCGTPLGTAIGTPPGSPVAVVQK